MSFILVILFFLDFSKMRMAFRRKFNPLRANPTKWSSTLNCANYLTGFYMRATLALNGLIRKTILVAVVFSIS